ncbi:MAG: L-rhamnose mutarotase [Acidimicrobiales bacterium]|jgi:L-rhamnose mutarotase
MTVKRVAAVIQLRAEKEAQYRELHAQVWPGVLATLHEAGVTNYSIFLRDGLLFSYLEFTGEEYGDAMKRIADDPTTKEWWAITDPCQQPVGSARAGEWWVEAEELFHLD